MQGNLHVLVRGRLIVNLKGWLIRPLLSMGAVFSVFGGLYYWFENITGIRYSDFLAKLHFFLFFGGVNITFFPMHYLGVAGMPRRIPDYPDAYFVFNWVSSCGSLISVISLIIFFVLIIDAFLSTNKNS